MLLENNTILQRHTPITSDEAQDCSVIVNTLVNGQQHRACNNKELTGRKHCPDITGLGFGTNSTPGQGFCHYGQNRCPSSGQAGVGPLQHAPC